MNKTINIRIGIGAMCDSIHKQLNKQGVRVTKPEVDHFQRAHDGFVQYKGRQIKK